MNSEMKKPTVLPENDNIEEAAPADATEVIEAVTDGTEAEKAPVNEETSEAADEAVAEPSDIADEADADEPSSVEDAEAEAIDDADEADPDEPSSVEDAEAEAIDDADKADADEAAEDTEAKESEDGSPAPTNEDTAEVTEEAVTEDEAAVEVKDADEAVVDTVEAVVDTDETVEDTDEAVVDTDEAVVDTDEALVDTDEAVEVADEEAEAATEETEAEAIPEKGAAEEKAEPVHHTVSVPHEKKKKAKKENGARRVDALFDFIELFVFTLAAVLFITSFFVRHSVVDGDSMLGTLHDGENLLISDLFYTPERGDVIVVDDHSTLLKKPIIKRVIAVGGDVVRITRHGVFVNGEPLVEDYVFTDEADYTYEVYPSAALMENDTLIVEAGEYYELTVPEGELFVMGDHRNKSTDSREIGTVDEDAVLGRVILRFYPFDKFGEIE